MGNNIHGVEGLVFMPDLRSFRSRSTTLHSRRRSSLNPCHHSDIYNIVFRRRKTGSSHKRGHRNRKEGLQLFVFFFHPLQSSRKGRGLFGIRWMVMLFCVRVCVCVCLYVCVFGYPEWSRAFTCTALQEGDCCPLVIVLRLAA